MTRALALIAFAAALVLAGCTEDRGVDDELAGQLAEIDSLSRANMELAERSAALDDSLDTLVSNLREMMGEVRERKKLRAALDDPRTGLWEPGPDALSIRFARPVPAASLDDLVRAFNERFSGSGVPQARLLSVDGSTARVGVSDDALLSERMGSAGSTMYLASLTYTLTSFPGIDRLFLDIRPGSHAGPGYLSRATFPDLVPDFEGTNP